MKVGDEVVYTHKPLLFGKGTIKRVTSYGDIAVGFADGTVELFHPQELELVDIWLQAHDLEPVA